MARGTALRQIHRLFNDGAVAALPDEQLLARFVANRDEAAFEALVARHGPMVLTLCRAILKDDHDAEDAFQATFLVFARKAGSLWAHDNNLGGWLHRVAYRIARRAEADSRVRRTKEAAVFRSGRDGAWDDWIPLLHEEIDRLPETQRAPIVLCDLQEFTYEQAAQQLQWTVPTLRCRLAKARERLRSRLTRGGLTGASTTLGSLLGSRGAKAAVPEAWIQAATRAAIQGGATTAVSALATGILKGMLLARVKAVIWLAVAFSSVAACVVTALLATGLGQTGDPPPIHQSRPHAIDPPARVQAAATPARDQAEDGETFDYRGRVVSPNGQPIANAKLYLLTSSDEDAPRLPWATTGPDGRFAFAVPASKFDEDSLTGRVTAVAPGFGVGLTDSEEPDAGRDLTIRLVEDLPIDGRLVDRNGQPVAGASVRVSSIFSTLNDNLDPWLTAIKGNNLNLHIIAFDILKIHSFFTGNETGAFPKLTTDPDGRFQLRGIGRERLVELVIEAPAIRLTRVRVMTRRCDPVQAVHLSGYGDPPESITYHGASPQLVASPCRPIEGIVRDQRTGKPIAGAKIRGEGLVDTNPVSYVPKHATSDAKGKYRIQDVPRGGRNNLTVHPPSGEPYMVALIDLRDAPDQGTIHQDVELVRGTLIEGRITDLTTGQPVSGCEVIYHLAADNPNLEKVPDFRLIPPFGYVFRTDAKDDGTFQIAALPGPGLLTIYTPTGTYPDIDPDECELPGSYIPEVGICFQAGVPITIAQGVERQRQDIQLTPGVMKEVTCVDPDGKPLKGAFACGLDSLGGWTEQPNKDSMFYVEALRMVDAAGLPGQVRSNDNGTITWSPRTLLFLHEERKLAGWLDVRGNEAGPIRVRLEPWGTAVGRVVDANGNAQVDFELTVMVVGKIRPGGIPIEHRSWTTRTDAEGRFHIEGLAPGLTYEAVASLMLGQVSKGQIDVTAIKAGETRDMGDVTITVEDEAN